MWRLRKKYNCDALTAKQGKKHIPTRSNQATRLGMAVDILSDGKIAAAWGFRMVRILTAQRLSQNQLNRAVIDDPGGVFRYLRNHQ